MVFIKAISDLARELEVPEQTLRGWVSRGVVPGPDVISGRAKYYTQDQYARALKRGFATKRAS